MSTLHPWLGLEFAELLPELQTSAKAVRIAVTRPFGRSYGEGALRVVRVRGSEEGVHLLLAYERYHSPPKPAKGSRLAG